MENHLHRFTEIRCKWPKLIPTTHQKHTMTRHPFKQTLTHLLAGLLTAAAFHSAPAMAAPAIGSHLHPGLRLLGGLPFVKPFFRAELARPLLRQVLSLTVHDTDRITDADVDEIGDWLKDPVMRATFLRILTTGVGLSGVRDEMLLLDRLDVIDEPVLLLWGRHDRILSIRNARDILKRLPQAQYVVLENSGHQLTYEEPAVFNRLVIDFLKT